MKRIAIMASGGGSNAEAIITYFKGHPEIEVALIISNKPSAGVLEKASKYGIASLVISNKSFEDRYHLVEKLKALSIDWIALAGYLSLIPQELLSSFPNKIVNIHPSLLPKYGGKGMYGKHVHHAVFEAKEQVSGMTIHYVNGKYDDGKILLQARCNITHCKDPDTIAAEVLKLEHYYYPITLEAIILA